MVRLYNNLKDRRDCQTAQRSYKTSHILGWVVGRRSSTDSGAAHLKITLRGRDKTQQRSVITAFAFTVINGALIVIFIPNSWPERSDAALSKTLWSLRSDGAA